MTQPITPQLSTEATWRIFIRKHWAAFAGFTTAGIVAAATAVYVFTWFTANALTTGLVPTVLNLWSINNIVIYAIYGILWELAIVGIPVALAAIAAWQWWKRVPETEKTGLHTSKHKSKRAGGAISPLLFIAFAIKIYLDGNWNQAIASWTLDYVIGSMVTILIWTAAIFAIPAIIGVIWWLSRR